MRPCVVLLACIASALPMTAEAQTCERDLDCPSDGLCEDGQCVAPGGGPVQVEESRPPRVEVLEDGTRVEAREVTGIPALWMSGLAATGLVYATTIGIAAGVCRDDCGRAIAYNAIPVVGPLITLGSDLDTKDYSSALVISTIFQAAGVTLVVAGLTLKRTELVPAVALGDAPDSPKALILPGPVGARGGVGVNVSFVSF